MNKIGMKLYVCLSMIFINCDVYASDKGGWTPWHSPDFNGSVIAGQEQLKVEQDKRKLESDSIRDEEKLLREMQKNEEDIEQPEMQNEEKQRINEIKNAQQVRKIKQKQKAEILALNNQLKRVEKELAEKHEQETIENFINKSKLEVLEIVRNRKEALLNNLSPSQDKLYAEVIMPLLHKVSVSENDASVIKDGHMTVFNMDIDLESRELPWGGFLMGNIFWPKIFADFICIVDANLMEVSYEIKTEILQNNIKELLDNEYFSIKDNFKDNILRFSPTVITTVHDRLSTMCRKEHELIKILITKKSSNIVKIAIENLKDIREMLAFMDENKKL